ncbi:MAG TPA: FAD/NAD(P)-binding protein, partial [Microbacteriaceae bacterium]|nr:FAD/NAD(P)-binding protein [Microbacteriaceae bacterium]
MSGEAPVAGDARGAGRVIVVVGAGPRAIGWLERFAANLPLFAPPRVTIHLVDPYPPGAGRVWRLDQSPLVLMNSMAADVTMFTDDSVQMDGPVAPGPSLAEWAAAVRSGRLTHTPVPEDVRREIQTLGPHGFASRRLQGVYLGWVYRRVLASLPEGSVVLDADTAVGVDDLPGGRQLVRLASG